MPSIPEVRITVSAQGPVWLTVLDMLHLALLRADQNIIGESAESQVRREVSRRFADELLSKLEVEGLVSPDEAAAASRGKPLPTFVARDPEVRIQVTGLDEEC